MSLAAHSMAFLFISRCKEIGMQLKELPAFETLQQNCLESGLQMLQLQGKTILPVVQGGMGVGVSAGGLAGAVANLGAVGTISSVDLRRLHPDLMALTGKLDKEPDARQQIESANLIALDREIKKAQMLSHGRGLSAVNIMKALNQYPGYVAQALASGADAIVVGAGLPLDLPELAKDFPNSALIPILADARGVQLVVRKWEKKGRLPSAIVIEHPKLAGGHLGAANIDDLNDPRFNFDVAIPAILEFFKSAGLEGQIPLIAAGGISCREDILRLQALGASAVQLGTAFAVTQECDAPLAFKEILAHAKPEDLQEFISVAGLPARAVKTPWLEKYIRIASKLQDRAHVKKKCNMSFDCLQHCGLRDGHSKMGQFCIDQQLGHALTGDVQKGLFFRGSGVLPFGDNICSVRELLVWLMSGHAPMEHISQV